LQKTLLITGGNKGIGLALTKLFVEQGDRIIVVARDFKDFVYADKVECVEYDLTDVKNIPSLITQIGKVDTLINNAGVMYSLPYNDYPQEKVESMLKLNLESPIKLIEECVKAGATRVVNNASVAGYTGHPDIWYGMTKAALINATKSFAKIYQGKVIFNAVAPSPVDTDMQKVNTEERKEAFRKTVITGRFATAEEVAETMFWLATTSPEYINGTTVDINNGSFPR